MHLDSLLAQAGRSGDEPTGAISCPIYQTAAFRHPSLGQSTGYDYSRSANPTRTALESLAAEIEGGCQGFAFASGMAALATTLLLFRPGEHLVVSEDLYGGTYRLLNEVYKSYGLSATYVDTTDPGRVEAAITPATRGLLVETPSNPMMRISDLAALGHLAKGCGLLAIADNTFMTPYLQRPLDLGWDVVVHSATKFLGGHNDVVAGLVVAREAAVAERIGFLQNAAGAVLGPQDSWLLLRGAKTLALRLERQQANATSIAVWLSGHASVERVLYPGLPGHPGFRTHAAQATGAGGVLSFEVADSSIVERVLGRVRLVSFAESLGGVESLITFPSRQTHRDLPEEVRERLGISDRLLRLSVGIEASEDLVADLDQALS
ncbi:MAG: trans-sulfuration enzyme family protein [Chloroflexota bacterium]